MDIVFKAKAWHHRKMTDENPSTNLPPAIVDAVAGITQALVPRSLKALDRLIGGVIDIPVAKLAQYKAKIDAQSQSYEMVEKAIASASAVEAGADTEVVQQAVNILVRKEYRRHSNKQAVGQAMLEGLRENQSVHPTPNAQPEELPPVSELDEDWLNVFERYAEDASTERMQKLWGRVLAGEVRKPGKYSTRTLRFLSEFSQSDALIFADFCNNSFGSMAPKILASPSELDDLTHLLDLEASGLITGGTGLGLQQSGVMDKQGVMVLREGNLCVVFQGNAGDKIQYPVVLLTSLGRELVSLIPGRDTLLAARKVAFALRCEATKSCFLGTVIDGKDNVLPIEFLWQEGTPA